MVFVIVERTERLCITCYSAKFQASFSNLLRVITTSSTNLIRVVMNFFRCFANESEWMNDDDEAL